MNKLQMAFCVIVCLFCSARSIYLRGEINDLISLNQSIAGQNRHISRQIAAKRLLRPRFPKALVKAFSLVINEVRFLENSSGMSMNLSIDSGGQYGDISDYFLPSEYHGVKKLPVFVQVDQFSSQTDMAAVLNDIYLLEVETDFKVNEINWDNGVLIVKGAVYGL